MGNTNSCVRHLQDVLSFWMGGSREREDVVVGIISAGEGAPCLSSPDLHLSVDDLVARATTIGSDVVSVDVERRIEQSKSHWSEVTEFDSGSDNVDVEADNWEVFKDLLSHPTWGGTFFRPFGYDFGGWSSDGSLEIGKKFAEGGQAELFHAKVTWMDPEYNEWDWEHGREWVVKVFKKGTPLRHLQSQWPLGMLQFRAEAVEYWVSPTPKLIPRFFCDVVNGTLLEDGRFAFLMEKEHLDLRTLIDRNMMISIHKSCGPFSKDEVENIMFDIALGMSWLHSRDIVHRDLKASNVLIHVHDGGHMQGFVADYECSIGVVGTGFFRAPEILKACQDKSISKKLKLFTKLSNMYSYGMTCYEILTGKLPFDGHSINAYADCVINGERPKVPKYVDAWIDKLLGDCWHCDPCARPSFEEVVNTILENSARTRKKMESGFYKVDRMDWINLRSLVCTI